MVQGTFDDLGTPLSSVTFVVVDLETTGGSPAECGITEIGAVKVRGGEVRRRVPDPGQPRWRHPGLHLGAHRHHRLDGAPARRASSRRCRRSSSSPPGRCSSPTTPASTSRSSRRAARRTEHAWPGFAVLDTVHLARQLVHRDEVPNHRLASLAVLFRRHHHARPPRAARRPRHRRRAARPASSGSARSACTPSRSCSTTPPGSPPPGAASGTSPTTCPTCPGVYLFKDGQGRVLYVGTSVVHPHPGALLLHGLRAPPPDGRDGAHRRVGQPDRLRHHPRGRGPRAAADRRAQAALQPPLAQPRAGAVGQAHRRAVPPAVDRAHRRRRRRRATPARSARARPPRPPWPPCTRCCRCASASSGSPRPSRGRRACWPTWAAAAPRAPGAQSVADYALVADRAVDLLVGDTRDLLDALRARMTHLSDVRALRGRPGRARAAGRPGAAAPRARSASTPWPASPSWSPPGARCSAAGRSSACGTAGSPAAPRHRAAPTRCPTSRRCGPAPRSSRPRCRRARPPRPRRARRCCAGSSPPGCASSRSRGPGPARWAARPRCGPSSSRSRPPGARSPASPGSLTAAGWPASPG